MGESGKKGRILADKVWLGRCLPFKKADMDTVHIRAIYVDQFERSFDVKGRLTVPSEWRDKDYEEKLFLIPSKEGCLKIYPYSAFKERQDRVKDLAPDSPDRRAFERMAANAQNFCWDAQGRALVQERHRALAGLKKDALLVGVGTHFQIWDTERYRQAQAGSVFSEDLGM